MAFSRSAMSVERLVPRHAHELALALGADALQGKSHTLVVISALGVAADLGAEHALRRCMLGVALDADHAPALHRDAHRAGVGAIVRAGGVDGDAAQLWQS